jgi:hypothetical protein
MIRGEAATGYEPEQIPAFAQWGVKGPALIIVLPGELSSAVTALQIRHKGLIGQSLVGPLECGPHSMGPES